MPIRTLFFDVGTGGGLVVATTGAIDASGETTTVASKIGTTAGTTSLGAFSAATVSKIGLALAISAGGFSCACVAGPLTTINTTTGALESSVSAVARAGKLVAGNGTANAGIACAVSAGKLGLASHSIVGGFRMSATAAPLSGLAVWPAPNEVKVGVLYGPNGNDYIGTYVDLSFKLELETSRLYQPLTGKVGILL